MADLCSIHNHETPVKTIMPRFTKIFGINIPVPSASELLSILL